MANIMSKTVNNTTICSISNSTNTEVKSLNIPKAYHFHATGKIILTISIEVISYSYFNFLCIFKFPNILSISLFSFDLLQHSLFS